MLERFLFGGEGEQHRGDSPYSYKSLQKIYL